MAANNKIDRALRGPGFLEIVFGVLAGISAGMALGVFFLIIRPVEVVQKRTDNANVSLVYFVEGSSRVSKSHQWGRKRQILADGRAAADVVFSEDELNAWLTSLMPKVPQAAAASPGPLTPEQINFRIQGGVMQVGLVGKLSALGFMRPLVVQTRGKFVPGSGGFEFVADEFYIGSFPAHMIPGLPQTIIRRVMEAQQIPEDIKTAWRNLKLVAVEGNGLHITLP